MQHYSAFIVAKSDLKHSVSCPFSFDSLLDISSENGTFPSGKYLRHPQQGPSKSMDISSSAQYVAVGKDKALR
jgi:hypothetical protein